MPRFCGGKLSARMACAIGCRPPPPAPCITRKRIRTLSVGAMPQSSELIVNRVMHSIKKRLRPNTPASHPLIGRTIAFETRYEVNTQVLSSLLAPRLPAMCGRATLAMLVSSTSMKAASATTTAIAHGLYLGFQASGTSAIARLLEINLRIDRHAGPQAVIVVLAGVEVDANRNALHHLDVVSGGILRRQNAEPRTAGAAHLDDFSGVGVVVGVDREVHVLAGLHAAQLGLLEVGDDPDIVE